MKSKDLKVGYPLYYITSTKLLFTDAIIYDIKLVDKRLTGVDVYRVSLWSKNNKYYTYLGFTDILLDDIVYLTKDEYDNRIVETESSPGVIIDDKNHNYWNCHKKELLKIKFNAFIYRIKKFLSNIYI